MRVLCQIGNCNVRWRYGGKSPDGCHADDALYSCCCRSCCCYCWKRFHFATYMHIIWHDKDEIFGTIVSSRWCVSQPDSNAYAMRISPENCSGVQVRCRCGTPTTACCSTVNSQKHKKRLFVMLVASVGGWEALRFKRTFLRWHIIYTFVYRIMKTDPVLDSIKLQFDWFFGSNLLLIAPTAIHPSHTHRYQI